MKPMVKVLSIVAGLVLLALVGSTAKAIPNAAAMPVPSVTASASTNPSPSPTPVTSAAPVEHARRATADDPVTINSASLDDLRRLPGIGPKRAQAILDLRTKLGHFRHVEDLMRVKGIGRATLKKLRPLVRLD
ncbi:MAG: ComEA family DNA-binding protein [Polyangiaceae bacterium]